LQSDWVNVATIAIEGLGEFFWRSSQAKKCPVLEEEPGAS
jgi:hypothetical protein